MSARLATAAIIAAIGLLPAAQAQAQGASSARLSPGAERGRQVAERLCAACHAIGPADKGPSAMAPPFRALRMRYNPISLERHIASLAATGYFGMPPQSVSEAEARDVADYIETLREP